MQNLKRFEKIEEALHGNGKPGLITEVTDLKRIMQDLQKHMADEKAWSRRVFLVCLGALLTSAGNVLPGLIGWLAKHLN